jgi:hypothetical protein
VTPLVATQVQFVLLEPFGPRVTPGPGR